MAVWLFFGVAAAVATNQRAVFSHVFIYFGRSLINDMESDPKSKTRVKFSPAQDVRLLFEVEKRPILWDPTLDIYKRADLKTPVWAQVAQNIGPELSGER